MAALSEMINERLVSVCGQMGVIARTFESGVSSGPPADSEYAVEPVGVQTIKPSAFYSVSSAPLTRVSSRIKRESAPRLMTASLSPRWCPVTAFLRTTST